MKAIILGTGATIGTLGKSAGVMQFEERLTEVSPSWDGNYPVLKRAIDDCKKENGDKISLDRLWTRIDYYSKFRKILGCEYESEVSIQLHKAVLVAYSFEYEISQIRTASEDKDFTLKRELTELSPGDALISFNWDTLAENIAMNMLDKDLVQVPYPYNGKHIRLIKPHGSLSWIHKPNEPIKFQEDSKPKLTSMSEKEFDHGAEPLVLGAVPMKSELLEEIQKDQSNLHATISAQWRETVNVISQVDEVVVLGYSFPAEDAYGRFLLSEAVRRRPENGKLPKIQYYALKKDCDQFEKAFREIFSEKVNYEYKGEVKPDSQPDC